MRAPHCPARNTLSKKAAGKARKETAAASQIRFPKSKARFRFPAKCLILQNLLNRLHFTLTPERPPSFCRSRMTEPDLG